MSRVLLLLSVCSLVSLVRSQISLSGPSKVRLVIERHRNETRHWITQVSLSGQPKGADPRKPGSWILDLDEDESVLGDDHTLRITATLKEFEGASVPLQASRRKRDAASSIFLKRPDDYTLHGHGYYKLHDYGATYCMASLICKEEGAHLMVINSESEAEVVKILFDKYPTIRAANSNNWAYVGLREKGQHGVFFSVLGESLDKTGYSKWRLPWPNVPGTNDCATVERSTADLGDTDCNVPYPFICEHFDSLRDSLPDDIAV